MDIQLGPEPFQINTSPGVLSDALNAADKLTQSGNGGGGNLGYISLFLLISLVVRRTRAL